MPFVYLKRVKRPDESYFRNAILGHDLPVLLLAYAMASVAPVMAGIGIVLFLLGFFSAYEVGYFENDRLGLSLEKQPKVSPAFVTLGAKFDPRTAWSFAILLSGLASWCVAGGVSWIPSALGFSGIAGVMAVWGVFIGFMVVVRVVFHLFNVMEPKGRVIPMLGLQILRTLGYALVLPTATIGALFCVAHSLAKWVPYVVYRFGGTRRDIPNHVHCLLILCLLIVAVSLGQHSIGWAEDQNAAVILLYVLARAGKDLLKFRRHLKRLDAGASPVRPGEEAIRTPPAERAAEPELAPALTSASSPPIAG
jgi:hypothetical protein